MNKAGNFISIIFIYALYSFTYRLFFTLIDVLIPFVIHGFASCLILRLDKILTGAWLFTTAFNFL